MDQKWANNAFSTVASAIDNTDTTLAVAVGHGDRFPAVSSPDYFLVTLQDALNNIEIVKVTARSIGSDSMTIVRAQDSTPARSWSIGAIVELRVTAAGLSQMATQSDTETLTNKTINGANNTLTVRLANDVSGTLPIANGGTGSTSTTYCNLTSNVTGTLPVANGGTGQTSYTNGQLLIGNTTGNTLAKATLTGTTNQITVTNGAGSITLSTPQNIHTTATPQFGSLGIGTAASGTTGEIRATNNITAYYSSDERLKENVEQIGDAVSLVNQLRGVRYDWTKAYIDAHGGEDGYFVRKQDIGVIAQEIELVFPELVAENSEGYKAVRYDRLVAVLIEAVKELVLKVEALEVK